MEEGRYSERTPLLNAARSVAVDINSDVADELTRVPVFSANPLPLTLSVQNLSYTILPTIDPFDPATIAQLPSVILSRTHKVILQDISLTLLPGQLLAVLGSSGSGKTSMLDVLACRQDGGEVRGSLRINNIPITQDLMKRLGGYVVQEDRLLPHLTVRETLLFVAQMKMPADLPLSKKSDRVDVVMSELGLRHVADTIIGGATIRGISGGERRRVSIGAQLLLDPSILFLDEPTSGLDAFTAHYIMRTLQNLARSNRTVITTIHAPRSDIFLLFDKVMLLSQGRCVYFGEAHQITNYFARLGYPCPKYTSPADFYLDLSTIDFRSQDKEQNSRQVVSTLVKAFEDFSKQLPENDQQKPAQIRMDSKSVESLKQLELRRASGFTQWRLLTARSFKNFLMDKEALFIEAVQTLTMSAVVGAIFWELGYDQLSVTDRYGLSYILSTLFQFMITLQTIATFHRGRPSFYTEQQDGLYSLAAFFWGAIFAELPFNIFFSLVYSIPIYFFTGLDLTWTKFLVYNADIFLSMYCSRACAYAVAAIIVKFQQASFTANFIFTLFVLPAGFIFNLADIFIGVRWLGDVSYIRYSFQALAINEFPGLTFECPTYGGNYTCQYRTGQDALETLNLEDDTVWSNMLMIIAITCFFRLVQYLALRFINQRPRD